MATGRVGRIALVVLMGALAVGAALAVYAVLTQAGEELTVRLLGTVGFLAFFSLTGLCSALSTERGILPAVGITGIVASAGGFLLGLAYVWEVIPTATAEDVRPLGAAVVGAVALGWTSLLLLRLRRSAAVTAVAVATMGAVAALAGLLLAAMFAGGGPGEGLARATAVAAILAVLGSFVTPMLSVVMGPPGSHGAPPEASGAPSRGR